MVKERRSKNIGRKQRKKKNTHKRRVSKRNTLRRKNFRGGAQDMYVGTQHTGEIMQSISDENNAHYHIYRLGRLEENAQSGAGGFVKGHNDTYIVTKIITNSSIFKYLEREDSIIFELATVNYKNYTSNEFGSMEWSKTCEWFLVFLPYAIKVSDFSHAVLQSCYTEECKEKRIQDVVEKVPFLLSEKITTRYRSIFHKIVKSIINEKGEHAPELPSHHQTLFPVISQETDNPVTTSD